MFKHNIIISFRNFKRYPSTLFINLIGLSTAIASVLLIYLWVSDELSVDKFHKNHENIYQVYTNFNNNEIMTWHGVPGPLYDEAKSQLPKLKKAVISTDTHEYTVYKDDVAFKANGKFASPELFEVFTYPLMHGSAKSALSDKYSIVLTESLAKKFFNKTDVVGETISWRFWSTNKTFQISAVVADPPKNASESFEFILPWEFYHDELINYKGWKNFYGRLYLQLEETDVEGAEKKVNEIFSTHKDELRADLMLVPFSKKYLHSNFENGKMAGGRIDYVRLFSIVGALVLLIAAINFINLSTAKASHKAKETGIKKTIGASKASLVWQHLTESTIISFLATAIALVIVYLVLPQFNFVTEKSLSLSFSTDLLVALSSVILGIGFLAGIYPAFYLSRTKAIEILKGKLLGSGGALGRKVLVVTQFGLSTVMIIAVVIVYQQMEFVKNRNLGYDRENIIYF